MKSGTKGGILNIQHSLRLLKNEANYQPDIDLSRSHLNQFKFNNRQTWTGFSKTPQLLTTKETFSEIHENLEETLILFKKQHKLQNTLHEKHGNYKRIKSFTSYMSKKQPIGEWVMGGSREWFARNNVIEIIDDKTYQIKNEKRLHEWRDTVTAWAVKQITSHYGSANNILSVLHLDETNVHIHFFYSRAIKKFNEKKGEKVWTFSHKGFLEPIHLKALHQSYFQYQNQELFHNLSWAKSKMLSAPENTAITKRKYLPLMEYKLHTLENKLQNKEAEWNNNVQNNKRLYGYEYSKIVNELHKAVLNYNDKNIIICHEKLSSLGHTSDHISLLMEDINQTLEQHDQFQR